MPKFMRSIRIPIVENNPPSTTGEVIIYGTLNGISQNSPNGGDTNFDIEGLTKEFTFLDASPILIGKIVDDLTISKIIIDILVPFNNLSTTISIGDNLDNLRLMDVNSNDPNVIGKYTSTLDYKYNTDTDIYIYINGVNTQGSAKCYVYYN